jgi:ribosomal protein S18 acetylase RimI-like enzyme
MAVIRTAEIKNTDSIVELLNEVTLHLHVKGINQWSCPWNSDKIELDIKDGHVYVLLIDDLICGTFSLKDMDNRDFPLFNPNSKYLYRIAILPEYQGMNLGTQILNYVCKCSENFDQAVYLDCWAGNKKLRSFYSNAGFEFKGDFPEEDYFISIFKYQNKRMMRKECKNERDIKNFI